jgi:hypothetical protein
VGPCLILWWYLAPYLLAPTLAWRPSTNFTLELPRERQKSVCHDDSADKTTWLVSGRRNPVAPILQRQKE